MFLASYKSLDGLKLSQTSLTTSYQHSESKKKIYYKAFLSQILFIVTFFDGAMQRTSRQGDTPRA